MYDWLRTVETALIPKEVASTVPLLPEAFSWEKLSAQLARHFELAELKITLGQSGWVADAANVLAHAPYLFDFKIGEMPGFVSWVLPQADLPALMSGFLTRQGSPVLAVDADFQKGFLQYVVAEILFLLNALGFHGALTPRLQPAGEPPAGELLSINLRLELFGKTYFSSLLATKELVEAWQAYCTQTHKSQPLPSTLAEKVPVTLQFLAGHVDLSQEAWKNIALGDYVVLDNCTLVPGGEKGRVVIAANGVPLFRGMLKKDQIKILEYPLYHEVHTPMSQMDDEESEKEFSEFEDEEEISEESEEEESLDPLEELPEEEDPSQDKELQEPKKETAPLATVESVPLHLVIELGRVQMTLAKLRLLEPGQMLDLEMKPEEGVNLVLNGVCVGRGELLRMGETLGVRILELG